MCTRILLILAFVLHLGFALGELLPWDPPLLLDRVIEKIHQENPNAPKLLSSPPDQKFVSIIVHNAGVYNLILAAGFFGPHYHRDLAPH